MVTKQPKQESNLLGSAEVTLADLRVGVTVALALAPKLAAPRMGEQGLASLAVA